MIDDAETMILIAEDSSVSSGTPDTARDHLAATKMFSNGIVVYRAVIMHSATPLSPLSILSENR